MAMKACPYRKEFFAKLATDPEGGDLVSDDRFNADLDKWLAALDAIVTRVQKFYTTGGYDKF